MNTLARVVSGLTKPAFAARASDSKERPPRGLVSSAPVERVAPAAQYPSLRALLGPFGPKPMQCGFSKTLQKVAESISRLQSIDARTPAPSFVPLP